MDSKARGQDKEHTEAGHSSCFYQNRGCEYFPCHDMAEERLNCLFCYCPLYHAQCPGEAKAVRVGDVEVRDCSLCDFPHRPENYDAVLERVMEILHRRS